MIGADLFYQYSYPPIQVHKVNEMPNNPNWGVGKDPDKYPWEKDENKRDYI